MYNKNGKIKCALFNQPIYTIWYYTNNMEDMPQGFHLVGQYLMFIYKGGFLIVKNKVNIL